MENETKNPFALQKTTTLNEGAVAIEQSKAVADAQGKMFIAKTFPRNEMSVYEKVMASCSRKAFANSAFYSFPRGGQNVTGPSIRFAEELARCFGNLEYGIAELSNNNGETEMLAYAWDVESNVRHQRTFTVKHERSTRGGVTILTDQRDIYELGANLGARRLRACILAILPPDLVDEAIQKCKETISGKGSEPLKDRVKKMITAFSALGVTVVHLEAKLGKKTTEILEDEFFEFIGIYNSIKEKQAKPSDFFSIKTENTESELNKAITEVK